MWDYTLLEVWYCGFTLHYVRFVKLAMLIFCTNQMSLNVFRSNFKHFKITANTGKQMDFQKIISKLNSVCKECNQEALVAVKALKFPLHVEAL